MVTDVAVAVPKEMLAWVAGSIGTSATILDVRQLRRRTGPWRVRVSSGGSVVDAVLKAGPAVDWRESYDCEIAALELAAEHGVPVPRVLGSRLDASGENWVALLLSWLDASGAIPQRASRDRLRTLGRTAARLHAVPLAPSARLPTRVRHTGWVDFSLERRAARRYDDAPTHTRETVLDELIATEFRGWPREELRSRLESKESSPLFDAADDLLARLQAPDGPGVFVHGDLWQGNTLWSGDVLVGLIDWETAGSGQAGVDLGCLRWDAAILFGGAAPDEVLAGWEEAAGRPAPDIEYWDLVAALNTPADLGRIVPSLHEAGRTDLDAETIDARQEAFLRDVLLRLGEDVS